MCFAIVRANGCSRAEQLFAKHTRFGRFWERAEKADDPERKLLGSFPEVVIFCPHFNFLIPNSSFRLSSGF